MQLENTALSPKPSFSFILYLSLLSIVGFLATDMYLPAFEAMRNDLQTSKNSISSSLSIYLGGFAFAQLIWGPIADKYGKTKTVLAGMVLFGISSICIVYAHSIFLLLLMRFIQAIGACSAAVSWQAMIIERYSKEQTTKLFASIMPLVGLTPALAPIIGVFMMDAYGWRSIFFVLFVLSILIISYTLTIKEQKNTFSTTTNNKNISYFTFFQSFRYIGNVIIYAFCSAAFFAWLTGSPFFLKELGYSEDQIGLSFIPQTIAFMLGGYGSRYTMNFISSRKLIPFLLVLFSISVFGVLFISLWMEKPTLTLLLLPFCTMAFSNGACYPIVVSEALLQFPQNAGKATALQNTIQLSICFIASMFVSIFTANVLLTTSIVMASTSLFVGIGFWLTKR